MQGEVFNSGRDKRLATDSDGLIRVKTKVSDRVDEFNFRYLVVSPSHRVLVTRLIEEIHRKNRRVGTRGLLALLRRRIRILAERKTLRGVVPECVRCHRFESKAVETCEIPLSEKRVGNSASATFEVTGVDLDDPLILKDGSKARIRLYICLYIARSTRNRSLVRALKIFFRVSVDSSREEVGRKSCGVITSTDFVGVERILSNSNRREIEEVGTTERIKWLFTPPSAPRWRGWWELLIGMTKRPLGKVSGRACLTLRELYSVMCDCESTMNSRPSTHLSEKSTELEVLRPSSFLRDLPGDEVTDTDEVDGAVLNSAS